MRAGGVACLVACVIGVANGQAVLNNGKWTYKSQETVTGLINAPAIKKRVYLGEGRIGNLRVINVAGCSNAAVKLVYAGRGISDCSNCLNDDSLRITTSTQPQRCEKTHQTTLDGQQIGTGCVAVEPVKFNTDYGDEEDYIDSADVLASATYTEFRAHGRSSYHYFVQTTVTGLAAGATCTLDVEWSAFASDPSSEFCVKPVDSTFQIAGGPEIEYFDMDAGLPRHTVNRQFAIKHRTIAGVGQGSSHIAYFNLGVGPQMEISCLHSYQTDVIPVKRGTRTTSCSLGATSAYSLELLDVFDCTPFVEEIPAASAGCCAISANTSASDAEIEARCAASTSGCLYVPEMKTCYPMFTAHSADLRFIDGGSDPAVIPVRVGDHTTVHTYGSSEVHKPASSYMTTDDEISFWNGGNWNRRWFIRFTNEEVSTGEFCDRELTLSFKTQTTGGLCEPSGRALCDTTAGKCTGGSDPLDASMNQLRFWRLFENRAPESLAAEYNEYQTCNCLKQKEACYRKQGCISTKRYQLVLQNCLDAGCGNYCNSASAASVSLLAVVAVLAAALL